MLFPLFTLAWFSVCPKQESRMLMQFSGVMPKYSRLLRSLDRTDCRQMLVPISMRISGLAQGVAVLAVVDHNDNVGVNSVPKLDSG